MVVDVEDDDHKLAHDAPHHKADESTAGGEQRVLTDELVRLDRVEGRARSNGQDGEDAQGEQENDDGGRDEPREPEETRLVVLVYHGAL